MVGNTHESREARFTPNESISVHGTGCKGSDMCISRTPCGNVLRSLLPPCFLTIKGQQRRQEHVRAPSPLSTKPAMKQELYRFPPKRSIWAERHQAGVKHCAYKLHVVASTDSTAPTRQLLWLSPSMLRNLRLRRHQGSSHNEGQRRKPKAGLSDSQPPFSTTTSYSLKGMPSIQIILIWSLIQDIQLSSFVE